MTQEAKTSKLDSGATCSGASSWIFQQITGESVIIEGIMRGATGALKK